jgi:hypothetical protein
VQLAQLADLGELPSVRRRLKFGLDEVQLVLRRVKVAGTAAGDQKLDECEPLVT